MPLAVERLLISTQHDPDVDIPRIKRDVIEHVLAPVMPESLCAAERLTEPDFVLVNPTGRFVTGGPMGDTGLTGRKIIVDTYGGAARHGGGAFSGKDPSKVDRSASYAARWVAKNVVAAGLAARAEVQVAYAIGVARPVSISVETFGTEQIDRRRSPAPSREVFDLRPAAIIRDLDLLRPIYRDTAAYGHFGRDGYSWERTRPGGRASGRLRPGRDRRGVIAGVQPLVTARAVDRQFDYVVPSELDGSIVPGSRVMVELGARTLAGSGDGASRGDGRLAEAAARGGRPDPAGAARAGHLDCRGLRVDPRPGACAGDSAAARQARPPRGAAAAALVAGRADGRAGRRRLGLPGGAGRGRGTCCCTG